jgi:hypothetical protein
MKRFVLSLFAVAVMASIGSAQAAVAPNASRSGAQAFVPAHQDTPRTASAFPSRPAAFVMNAGQFSDMSVHFAAMDRGMNVLLREDGIVFQPKGELGQYVPSVRAYFPGSRPVAPCGLGDSTAYHNYYRGNIPLLWREGVPLYSEVIYCGLYPGIDLAIKTLPGRLKYEFRVAPGGDPSVIQAAYTGIDGLRISDDGKLHILMPGGEMIEDAPYIYQVRDGEHVPVAGEYRLVGEAGWTVAITGAYDSGLPIVVDPDLAWATFLGGSHLDCGYSIAVDTEGSVLVTGNTMSSDFPVPGGWDTSYNGGALWGDVFVAKFGDSGGLLSILFT